MARRTSAKQRAAAKRNLEKARRKKRNFHAKNRKKIQKSRKFKRNHLSEYKKTGLLQVNATKKPKSWRQVVKSTKIGGRHNKKYAKRKGKLDRKIAKYQARAR